MEAGGTVVHRGAPGTPPVVSEPPPHLDSELRTRANLTRPHTVGAGAGEGRTEVRMRCACGESPWECVMRGGGEGRLGGRGVMRGAGQQPGGWQLHGDRKSVV